MTARFPTPDLTERLLLNGGRLPAGLFRSNYYRSKRSRGITPAAMDPIVRLVEELRHMLRDLTNLNVRQPSHMAPPFRATQWTYQVLFDSTLPAEFITIPINGNEVVPNGSIAVLQSVIWCQSPADTGTRAPSQWDTPGSVVTTGKLTLLRNGSALPGYLSLAPSLAVGLQQLSGSDFLVQQGGPPSPPTVPVTLYPADSLSWRADYPGVGQFYLQVSGYLYPIELDGDGVRGTLADRG